jgi:hypothetical protein
MSTIKQLNAYIELKEKELRVLRKYRDTVESVLAQEMANERHVISQDGSALKDKIKEYTSCVV